jgi:5'-methylthioadenosine phosphorylase
VNTFFGNGLVVHIGTADPFCPALSELLYKAVVKAGGARVHQGGVFIVIDGPQFSTKGESRIYRQWGVDIIGMTVFPEAKLAREAEICYAVMAHVTDYDVWHETEEPVSVAMLLDNLRANAAVTKKAIEHLIPMLPEGRDCECPAALASAIITDRSVIPPQTRKDLDLLIGKYLK